MRCRSYRWLWGLLPLSIIAIVAILGEHARIEADLAARTRTALDGLGFTWATADFSGRDAILDGKAVDEGEQRQATEVVRGTWGVRIVEDRAGLIERVSPYSWTASREENRIKLKGYVPSEDDRKTIMGFARASFPGFKIDDRMELARGAPPHSSWAAAVSYGMAQLSKLRDGQVKLTDLAFSIKGEAESSAGYSDIMKAIEKLPQGVTLENEDVTPPLADPYVFSAQFDGRQLVLGGYVPSEKARATLLGTARSRFPTASVADRTNLAAGVPQEWGAATAVILEQMARLNKGNAVLTGISLDFSGEAQDQDTAEATAKAVRRGLPSIYRSKENVTYVTARLKTVKPYVWGLDYDGSQAVVSGYVPSEDARKTVLAQVKRRMPAGNVVDAMDVGVGTPSEGDWLGAIGYAIDQVSLLKRGRAALSEYDLSITGDARDAGTYQAVIGALATPPAGFKIRQKDITPPEVQNYSWSLDSNDTSVRLDGYIPSEDARRTILDAVAARFPGRGVTDRMKVARGVPGTPRDWMRTVQGAIGSASTLSDGRASLNGTKLRVSGGTHDKALPSRIGGEVGAQIGTGFEATADVTYLGPTPEELALEAKAAEEQKKKDDEAAAKQKQEEEDAALKKQQEDEAALKKKQDEEAAALKKKQEEAANTASPFVWTAHYDGLTLEFSGSVPDEAIHQDLLRQARRLFPGRKIDDRTRVARGAPPGWGVAASRGLEQLSKLDGGEYSLFDNAAMLTGSTDSAATQKEARNTMASRLPQGFTGGERIEFVPPPEPSAKTVEDEKKKDEAAANVNVDIMLGSNKQVDTGQCDAAMGSVAKHGRAFFDSGSAELGEDGRKTLAKIAQVAKLCANAEIEIAGHTDSDGPAAFNKHLSEERAKAVADYLETAGIEAKRLIPVGYGEAEPVAPNTSKRNKARNRRIEFEVKLK